MDIVNLLKLLIKISLAAVPLVLLVAIVTAYAGELATTIGYITDNPFILIALLSMETALENTYIAIFFGLALMVVGVAAIFRVFG
jgi:hypothetical protein